MDQFHIRIKMTTMKRMHMMKHGNEITLLQEDIPRSDPSPSLISQVSQGGSYSPYPAFSLVFFSSLTTSEDLLCSPLCFLFFLVLGGGSLQSSKTAVRSPAPARPQPRPGEVVARSRVPARGRAWKAWRRASTSGRRDRRVRQRRRR